MATELAALAVNIETNGAQNAMVALAGIDKAGTGTAQSLTVVEQTTRKSATAFNQGIPHARQLTRAIGAMGLEALGVQGPVGRVIEILAVASAGGGAFIVAAAAIAAITYALKLMEPEAVRADSILKDLTKTTHDFVKAHEGLGGGTGGARTDIANQIAQVNAELKRLDNTYVSVGSRVVSLKDLRLEWMTLTRAQRDARFSSEEQKSAAEDLVAAYDVLIGRLAHLRLELRGLGSQADEFRKKFSPKNEGPTDDAFLKKFLVPNQDKLKQTITNVGKQIQDGFERLEIGQSIGQTLGDAITAGIEAAFTGKDPLGAFAGALIHGIAGIMRTIGEAWIAMGITSSISPLSGPGAIAAGAALVAAASALDSAVQSDIKTVGTGGGSSSGGFSTPRSGSLPTDYAHYTIGGPVTSRQSAYPSAAGPALQVVVIGPDDPTAQRQIMRLISNAQRRGL